MHVAQCEVTCYIKALEWSLFVFNISFHCSFHASYDTSLPFEGARSIV
jgi:hypothetical protein